MGKQTRASSADKSSLKKFPLQQSIPFPDTPSVTGVWSRSWSMYCPIAIKRVVKRDEGLGDVPIIVLETVLEDGKFILGTNKPVRASIIPLEYHPIMF